MKYSSPRDRDRLDAALRYVADARARRQPLSDPALEAEERSKADRYGRSLARRYYRTTLQNAFECSRPCAAKSAISVAETVDSALFESFLAECLLGSLDSARRVGDFAVSHLGEIPNPPPWWRDLLAYERACFLQLATTDPGPRTYLPRRGNSAVCIQFSWNIAELVKRSWPASGAPEVLKADMTLLFSRSPEGKLVVAQVDATTASVFRCVNGMRDVDKIAEAAGMLPQATLAYLDAMAAIGAVVMP